MCTACPLYPGMYRRCLLSAFDNSPAGDTVEDVPNSNTPGLVVGSGEKLYTAVFMVEELGRPCGISAIHSGVHGKVVPIMFADWTASDWTVGRLGWVIEQVV